MSGECPVCGTETEGVVIAGTVRDYTCDPCADETDANFGSFVDWVVREAGGGPTGEDKP